MDKIEKLKERVTAYKRGMKTASSEVIDLNKQAREVSRIPIRMGVDMKGKFVELDGEFIPKKSK